MNTNYISNLSDLVNDINPNDVNYQNTKAQLNNLIGRVKSKAKANTPFMLLPVRIEARFMTVSRFTFHQASGDAVINVATDILIARDLGIKFTSFNTFTDDTIRQAIGEWDVKVDSLNAQVNSVGSINVYEKSYLTGAIAQVEEAFGQFKTKVENFSFTDNEKHAQALAQIEISYQNVASLSSNTHLLTTNNGRMKVSLIAQNGINKIKNSGNAVNGIQTEGRTMAQINTDAIAVIEEMNLVGNTILTLAGLTDLEKFQLKKEAENTEFKIVNFIETIDSIEAAGISLELKNHIISEFNNAKGNLALKVLPVILNNTTEGFIGSEYLLSNLNHINGQFIDLLDGDGGKFTDDRKNNAIELYKRISNFNNVAQKGYVDESQLDQFNSSLNTFNESKNVAIAKMDEADIKEVISSKGEKVTFAEFKQVLNETSVRLQKSVNAAVSEGEYLLSHINTVTQPAAEMYSVSGYVRSGVVGGAFNSAVSYPLKDFSSTVYEDQLWVRMYPDDIFVETHEKDLTVEEKNDGIKYWQAWWAANGDKNLQLGAWRALCNSYGAARAAWIVKQLTPTNLTDFQNFHVDDLLADFDNLSEYLDVLNVANLEHMKGAEAFAAVLGDKFAVMNHASSGKFSASSLQGATLNLKMGDVEKKLNILGKNIHNTGSKELKAINSVIDKNFKKLNGTLGKIDFSTQHATRFGAPPAPLFPTVNLKNNSWSEPATSSVLPDRFVVMTYNQASAKKYRNIKIGERIPPRNQNDLPFYKKNDPLFLGLDPMATGNAFSLTSTGDMVVDPKIKWMVDFDEAVKRGMGIKLVMDKEDKVNGVYKFDKLFVLGLKLDEDGYDTTNSLKTYSRNLLEGLIESHHFQADGLSLVKIGTATNNSGKGNSEYNAKGPTADDTFGVELLEPLFANTTGNDIWQPGANNTKNVKSDGQWLSEALGVNSAVFHYIANAGKRQVSESIAANRALWSGTVGMYMQDMWGPVFTPDTIKRARDFFTDFVSARGVVPSIRVGNQPYGILPVSSLSRWKFSTIANAKDTAANERSKGINYYVKDLLLTLRTKIDTAYGAYQVNAAPVPFPEYLNSDSINSTNYPDCVYAIRSLIETVLPGNNTQLDINVLDYIGYLDYPTLSKALDNPVIGKDVDVFLQYLFEEKLSIFLRSALGYWRDIADTKVKVVESAASGNKQADFLEILGLNATAAEYYHRYAFNMGASMWMGDYYSILYNTYPNPQTGNTNTNIPQTLAEELTKEMWNRFGVPSGDKRHPISFYEKFIQPTVTTDPNGYNLADFIPYVDYKYGNNNETLRSRFFSSRFHKLRFLDDAAKLTGPTILDKKVSDNESLQNFPSSDFIAYLLNTAPLSKETNSNNWPVGNILSTLQTSHGYNSIMYLLMRQSYLATYRDGVMDFLIKRGVLREEERQVIGTPEGDTLLVYRGLKIADGYEPALSKWDFVFDTMRGIVDKRRVTSNKFIDPEPINLNYGYTSFADIISWNIDNTVQQWQYNANNYKDNLGTHLHNLQQPLGDYLRQHVRAQVNFTDQHVFDNSSKMNLQGKDLRFIKKVEDAFAILHSTTTADMEKLLAEHLDLCSYRLDAWINGLYNQRLAKQRKLENGQVQDGIYLGAYGVLLNVEQKSILKTVAQAAVPAGLRTNETVYTNSSNLGFELTPSIAHAMSAAILRSGYISEKYSSQHTAKLAVNLSSERVRTALFLVEGIQNGQQLGALLGYQFEKGLHERYKKSDGSRVELDSYIYKFRRRFPLAVPVLDSTSPQTREKLSIQNVVDGIAMLNAVRTQSTFEDMLENDPNMRVIDLLTAPTNQTIVEDIFKLSNGDVIIPHAASLPVEFTAICTEIDRLADMIDSLGDLLVVEGIYQAVSGNYEKTSNTVQTLAEGDVAHGIPDSLISPRSGTTISHKLIMQFEPVQVSDATSTVNKPWPLLDLTPRAFAEPSLNKWLGKLLPPPDKIMFRVHFKNISGVDKAVDVNVFMLGLQPIDLLNLVCNSSDGGWAELKLRIAYYVRENCNQYNYPITGVPVADADKNPVFLDIRFKERAAAWAVDTSYYTFFELYPVLEEAGVFINSGKPAKANDYIDTDDQAQANNPGGVMITELQNRAVGHVAVVNTFISNLQGAITIANKRENLLLVSFYGLSAAIPFSAIDTGLDIEADIVELVASVIKELKARTTQAQALISNAGASGTSVPQKIEDYINAISTLFGNSIKVYPLFNFENKPDLVNALTTGQGLLLNNQNLGNQSIETAMNAWLHGLGKVRNKIEGFEMLRSLAEDDSFKNAFIKPIQFPVDTTTDPNGRDFWLGIEYPVNYTPTGDKFSVVIADADIITTATGTIAVGVCVDEWTEIIPGKYETGGITFNYDQPNAKAPQSILLAVSPDLTKEGWLLEELVDTIHETLDMAKIRCVEPDHLNESFVGQVLPAVVADACLPLIKTDSNNEDVEQYAKNGQGYNLMENTTQKLLSSAGYINSITKADVCFDFKTNNTPVQNNNPIIGTTGTSTPLGNNPFSGVQVGVAGDIGRQIAVLTGIRDVLANTGIKISYSKEFANGTNIGVDINFK